MSNTFIIDDRLEGDLKLNEHCSLSLLVFISEKLYKLLDFGLLYARLKEDAETINRFDGFNKHEHVGVFKHVNNYVEDRAVVFVCLHY